MIRIFVFLIVGVFSLKAQTSYYISNDLGVDSPGFGQSPEMPFQSLDYAIDVLSPGDTLNVMAGIYHNENYGDGDKWKKEKTMAIVNKHGTSSAYIVIRPFQHGEVTLRGDGLYILHIRSSSYIRVEGFEIEGEVNNIPLDSALAYQFAYRENGSDEILYRVEPGTPPEVVETLTFEPLTNIERPSYFDTKGLVAQLSHHIIIKNNHIHHMPGTGLRFNGCSYMYAVANEINDCSRRSYSGTHALVVEATDDMNTDTGTKIWIQRNHVHHNYNEIYSWAPTKSIITPVIDEGKGISLQRNDAERGWVYGRIRIENNLTHHNGFSGLHINNCRGVDFVNNTSYHDSYTGSGNNHGISMQTSEDITIVNNIVVNDTSAGGFGIAASSSSSNYTAQNNLVFGTIDPDIEAIEENTIFANPLFVDAENLDFRLQAGSPAIDIALAAFAPAIDYNGQARADGAPDLGAFEYALPSSTKNREPLLGLQVFPNPFRDYLVVKVHGLKETVRLFDALGRECIGIVYESGAESVTLYTRHLEPGVYVLVAGQKSCLLIRQ